MEGKVVNVPIEKIKISKWDIRQTKEDENKLEALKRSIEIRGLFHPLTVLKTPEGYLLVAGRRRLRACKELGMSKVPVLVDDGDTEEADLRVSTVLENLHRRELNEYEKVYGILSIYKSAGYTKEQALEGTKSLDNWFSDTRNKGKGWEDFRKSVPKEHHPSTSKLRYDENFIKYCRLIGYSPKYQYQILQKSRDVPKSVLKKAAEKGLSGEKITLLTNEALRKHPKVQKKLVNDLAKKSGDESRDKIYQTISDLQTGALYKSGKNYLRDFGKRQKPNKDVESKDVQASRIRAECKKLIYVLTKEQVQKGKIRIEEFQIKRGRAYQVDIVKQIDENELMNVEENLELAQMAIKQMLDLIDQEFDSRKSKQELMSK